MGIDVRLNSQGAYPWGSVGQNCTWDSYVAPAEGRCEKFCNGKIADNVQAPLTTTPQGPLCQGLIRQSQQRPSATLF